MCVIIYLLPSTSHTTVLNFYLILNNGEKTRYIQKILFLNPSKIKHWSDFTRQWKTSVQNATLAHYFINLIIPVPFFPAWIHRHRTELYAWSPTFYFSRQSSGLSFNIENWKQDEIYTKTYSHSMIEATQIKQTSFQKNSGKHRFRTRNLAHYFINLIISWHWLCGVQFAPGWGVPAADWHPDSDCHHVELFLPAPPVSTPMFSLSLAPGVPSLAPGVQPRPAWKAACLGENPTAPGVSHLGQRIPRSAIFLFEFWRVGSANSWVSSDVSYITDQRLEYWWSGLSSSHWAMCVNHFTFYSSRQSPEPITSDWGMANKPYEVFINDHEQLRWNAEFFVMRMEKGVQKLLSF